MSTSVSTTTAPMRKVYVVGVGMTKFEKPGKQSWDYPDMGEQAAKRALFDANLSYTQIEQACIGYVYGDSTAGQRALYNVGLTGIPIYNVNNNCSTGSSALFMAKQLIQGGLANCVMALGFEKMERGSLGAKFTDRVNPLDRHVETMTNLRGFSAAPPAPQMFGNAGREHMEKYGTTKEQFAKIAVKNHVHSKNNPYSQFRDEYTLEQVLKSPSVYEPLTKLQCCPTSDGAACVIVCSEEFVKIHHLESQAVEIVAMAMRTDYPTSFESSCIKMVGFDMSKAAADAVYKEAGISAQDVQVIELHDCFSCNELLTYEALGLCKVGDGGKLIDKGDVTYGGKWVVNPSGGLISKGHPLGATGLAQCSELCWQLRKMAGPRQVPNAKMALQHNIGLGGAAVVGLYRLGFPQQFQEYPKNKHNYAISADSPVPSQEFQSAAIFRLIAQSLKSNPALLKTINGVFQFDLIKGTNKQSWTIDAKSAGTVSEGIGSANVIIEMSDEDFVGMMTGKLSARDLMADNKLKLTGDMTLAMKLRELASAIANQKSKL